MTQWKCFVPDISSSCDHICSFVELFSETEHKVALVSITIVMLKNAMLKATNSEIISFFAVLEILQIQRKAHIPSLDTSVKAVVPSMVMHIIANMSALLCGQHPRSLNNPHLICLPQFHPCLSPVCHWRRPTPWASQSTKRQGTIWSCFTGFS